MSWPLAVPAVLLGLYLAAILALALAQRRLIYLPPSSPSPPVAGFLPIRAGDRLLGWYRAPIGDQPLILFFHGNRGTLARVAARMSGLGALQAGLFLATYSGYEGNPGTPRESTLYEDGRAALDWLAGRGILGRRLLLYGESLGTGIAVQMALERPALGLVLEAPFTSLPAAAADRHPWTPARWLTFDRFDSLAKIGRLDLPILILHGRLDPTIPIRHAERLAAAARRCRFVPIEEGRHADLYEQGAGAVLIGFLEEAEFLAKPDHLGNCQVGEAHR